jgi:tetratricopeptide (TPR) repeat protein
MPQPLQVEHDLAKDAEDNALEFSAAVLSVEFIALGPPEPEETRRQFPVDLERRSVAGRGSQAALNLSAPITIIQRSLPYSDDFAARALERRGDRDGAIAEYERLLDPEKTEFSLVHPFSRLRLARLYEKKGKLRAAVKQYEKVLEVWKEADQGLTEVEEARRRLAALRAR